MRTMDGAAWGCFIVMISAVVMAIIVWSIISTVMAHERPEPQVFPVWSPPDIEQCDKELWDRIRYEC